MYIIIDRYLIDVKWMRQWKKYVGYDLWDQSHAGQEGANPGPVDNKSLIEAGNTMIDCDQ